MRAFLYLVPFCLLLLNSCKKDVSCTTCPPQGLDTTSHRFAWTQELLGDGGGSILRDVAIVNDTLTYACGEIYKRDSLGNWDPNAYNLVRWRGNVAELIRIPFMGPCSAVDYPPLRAIWVIAPNQILVTNGGAIATYNGTMTSLDCRMNFLLAGAINKLYALDADHIYAVGNSGTIVHYVTGTWQRLESGTNLPIRDIWGAKDPLTGETQILAVASDDSEKRLLRIQGTTVTMLPDSGLSPSVYRLWFIPNKKYYIVGAGIHQKNLLGDALWSRYPSGEVTSYASEGIRGNDINDVFVVGSFFEVVHFNGATWYNYRNEIPLANGALGNIAVKGNLVIAVGLFGQKAVAMIGRR